MVHVLARIVFLVLLALVVVPAWASNPGEPLDCSDWVFLESGLSCSVYVDDCSTSPGICSGLRIQSDNEGRVYRVGRTTTGERCGGGIGFRIGRTELVRSNGTNDEIVAYVEGRCWPSEDNTADGIQSSHVGGEAVLLFDEEHGRFLIPMTSYCAGAACNYGTNLWMASLSGFTTTFEILQSYTPPSGPISFRVPYMPEGFQHANWFDTYYGTLASVGDWSQLQSLQCGYPASSPSVGDYLTVADPLPTPSPGNGYYYVTAVNYSGETRYGRRRSGGMLSGRDPGVLPGCAD